MIPAQFDYVRPGTVDEAVRALQEAGEDAKILAGGQSLIPVLRLRLAAPSSADRPRRDPGAAAHPRRRRPDRDRGDGAAPRRAARRPRHASTSTLLALATATVADNQVRHRGTLGGSLAHADPAGDLGGVALALEAEFVITGTGRHPDGVGGRVLRRLLHHRAGRGRDPHRGAIPEVHGLGQPLREVQPHRAVVVDGGDRRGRPDRGRHDRRGAGGADATWAPPRCGRAASRRPSSANRRRPTPCGRRRERVTEGTAAPSDADAAADYREHLARVLTGRAVLAAAG